MSNDRDRAFGDLLRRLRRAGGLTQEELAERAGIAPETISALERGVNRAPHRDTMLALADALHLSAEERTALLAAARRPAVPIAEGATADAQQTMTTPAEPQRLVIGGYLGALPEMPLIAREAERAQLVTAVEAVARGEGGRLLLLSGEPGIGKTRLAQEVTVVTRDRGFLVLTGRCYEPQRVVAYYPFLDALTTAYAVAPASVRQELPQRWPEVARLLPDKLAGAQTPREAAGNGRDDQQRLFYQLTGLLRTLADAQPLAVLLDDLHWADGASLDLLQHLVRHTCEHRVLLLGTYREVEVGRQHPLDGALRDLTREHLCDRVLLGRLSPEGTRALLAASLGEPEVSAEFAALLHARTDGNPFFIREVLRALVERGDVFQAESGWDRKAIEEVAIPESIRSVIGQRIAYLPAESQEVLRAASVLGQSFTFTDLAAMSGRTEAMVETSLEEAAGAELVYEADGDAYGFRHALIHQTLYHELPARKRRRLHHAIADVIETLAESARQRRVAELAYHLLQAGDRERALPYCLRAGDQAEAVYAHAEAERHYRTALEVTREFDDPARAFEAAERLGDVLELLGRDVEARETYAEALASARHVPGMDQVRVALVWSKIGQAAMDQRDTAEAAHAFHHAMEALGEQPSEINGAWWSAWIQMRLSRLMLHYWQMEHTEMEPLIAEMRAPVEQYATPVQRSEYHNAITNLRDVRERFVPSDETLANAQAAATCLSEEPLLLPQRISSDFSLALMHLFRGELAEAEPSMRDILARAQLGEVAHFELLSLTYLTILARKLGRLEEVAQHAARSLTLATERQVPTYQGVALANQAWLAWRQDDLAAAETLSAEALACFAIWPYSMEWVALWPAIGVSIRRGRLGEAVESARRLLAPPQQLLPVRLRTCVERAIQAWDANGVEAARQHMESAMALAREDGYL